MEWDEYYQYMLKNAHDLAERLKVLDRAEQIFMQPYSQIDDSDFLYIAGVYKRDENNIYWDYFGTMNRTGLSDIKITKKIFIEIDKYFTTQQFQEEKFINFAKKIDKIKGVSLTAMSRLLALRYPNEFYCITSANEPKLLNQFQISKSIRGDSNQKKYERYWNEIIEPIQKSPWYNSEPPKNQQELKVWKGRVLLLDALFYKNKVNDTRSI